MQILNIADRDQLNGEWRYVNADILSRDRHHSLCIPGNLTVVHPISVMGGRYVSPRRQNQDLHVLEEGRIRPDIEVTSPVVPVLWPLKNDGWGWSVGHSAAG
jgi:hypothetical protein